MELSEINVIPEKEKQFNKKGIHTVEELLRYLPKNYYDFRESSDITEAPEGKLISVVAILLSVKTFSTKIGTVVTTQMRDIKSLEEFNCVWYRQGYMADKLSEMYFKNILAVGTLKYNEMYGRYEMTNPLLFTDEVEQNQGIFPVYPQIEGMADGYLRATIAKAIQKADKNEKYDEETRKKFHIVKESEMYRMIHKPKTEADIKLAKRRLVFEELYDFCYEMELEDNQSVSVSSYIIRTLEKTNQFIQTLPYRLTADQQKALNAMIQGMRDGKRTNAILQGDVGTGKTIVAIILMMAMAENGYQSVLMAPTSVVAEQHYKDVSRCAEQQGFKVAYLVASMKAAEKRKMIKEIKEGAYDLIVGTHAIISKDVEFHKLGMVVVDEEHRFGVDQKQKLMTAPEVHALTMSATPIPRTSALALYGKKIDVHTIETKPDGREPVRTGVYNNRNNIFEFASKEITKGRQCYIVCALKNENSKFKADSVEEVYEMTSKYFHGTSVKIGTMTGGMKKEEMQETLRRFVANEIQILIATTIVEVGVNVPNASTMIIWDADRYGLSTLHQLRGRVGRGSYQSYCILKSPNKDNSRLQIMCETTDGFEIAKKDLELRGSGDFLGTKQSGENKSVMLILHYPKFYNSIMEYIEQKMKDRIRLEF